MGEAFESAREVYKRQGLGERIGFGRRPAVLVIDMQNDFIDSDAPTTLAPASQQIIPFIQRLLALAHARRIPVFYTRGVVRADGMGESLWRLKMKVHQQRRCQIEGQRGAEVTDELRPSSGDMVITKRRPSAFFCTELDVFLKALGVDTLIICGVSASGCVRATVTDGFSRDYRCIIPRECVADRALDVFEANLFDMDSKYADVVPVDAVFEYVENQLERPASP